MKYLLIVLVGGVLMAAGCTDTKLPRETPSSPIESYDILPE